MNIIISIILNLLFLLSILLLNIPTAIKIFIFIILLIFWLCSFLGSIAYIITKNKEFGIVAIIGFLIFIPIGLLGIIHIKKLIDDDIKEEFLKN